MRGSKRRSAHKEGVSKTCAAEKRVEIARRSVQGCGVFYAAELQDRETLARQQRTHESAKNAQKTTSPSASNIVQAQFGALPNKRDK